MSKLAAMAMPILSGKTEQWRKFSNDLKSRYKAEYNESRKKLGVYERIYFQSTKLGDLVIVTLEGNNPEGAFAKFGEGNDEFTKYFNTQVKEIHGVDLTQKLSGSLPDLVIESEPVLQYA